MNGSIILLKITKNKNDIENDKSHDGNNQKNLSIKNISTLITNMSYQLLKKIFYL